MTHKQNPNWRQLYALAAIFVIGMVIEATWHVTTDIHKLLMLGWTGIFFALMAVWLNQNQRDFADMDRRTLVYRPRTIEEFFDADRIELQQDVTTYSDEPNRPDPTEAL
ncbi:MAG TPA: hypothetical protein VHO69_04990 [Phototrophicaceae bacterium]|nr:hypothetical protein [Phototrophicaceae bacterium]